MATSKKYKKLLYAAIASLLLHLSVLYAQPAKAIADLSLVTPVINTNPLPFYDYDKLDYGMNMSLEMTKGGRIWSLWTAGGDNDDAFLVLVKSDNKGRSWSKPMAVIDSHVLTTPQKRSVQNGALWSDPLGRLWLFFDQSMFDFDGRAGVWYSVCTNPDAVKPEWSTPVRLWHGTNKSKPIVLSDGTWLLPVSLLNRDIIDKSPGYYLDAYHELDPLRMAHVFVSKDQGRTWTRAGAVRFPQQSYDEHHLTEKADGTVLMTGRTKDGIYQSVSTDQGQTWSAPAKMQPHVNSRHFIRRLASGNLLLIRHGMTDEKTFYRSKLMAFLSDDDGRTWQGGLMLDERRGIAYPDGFEAPDGTIYISYDHNRATDGEILLARFTEKDILEGKLRGKNPSVISRPLGLDKMQEPFKQIK